MITPSWLQNFRWASVPVLFEFTGNYSCSDLWAELKIKNSVFVEVVDSFSYSWARPTWRPVTLVANHILSITARDNHEGGDVRPNPLLDYKLCKFYVKVCQGKIKNPVHGQFLNARLLCDGSFHFSDGYQGSTTSSVLYPTWVFGNFGNNRKLAMVMKIVWAQVNA